MRRVFLGLIWATFGASFAACTFNLDQLHPDDGTGGSTTVATSGMTTTVSTSGVTTSSVTTSSESTSTSSTGNSTSSSGGSTAVAACDVLVTGQPFTDDFAQPEAYWITDGLAGDVSWVSNSVHVSPGASELTAGLRISQSDTVHTYALEGCWTSLHVDPSGLAATSHAYLRMRLSDFNFEDLVELDVDAQSHVTASYIVGGSAAPAPVIKGDSLGSLRFRETAGVVYFETHGSTGDWVQLGSMTTPPWFQNLRALQFGVTDTATGHSVPDAGVFTEYNLAPE